MRISITLWWLAATLSLSAQSASLHGQLQSEAGVPVAFANVGLFSAADSSLNKAGTSDESGVFTMQGLNSGTYYLKATSLGFGNFHRSGIELKENQQLDLGIIALKPNAIGLEEVTVKASRVMVEIKPDRTIFNVDGTINSAGADALTLLRKAPSVTVDNNNNISVLGRSGVLLYVDGKRLPLTGDDLTSYLENLPAEQIDRIEIITNPGSKYEAEGNAGIIDIRLKRDKNMGANGSINTSYSQGVYHKANLSGTANYRNKRFNSFATAGLGNGAGFNNMNFLSYQNGLVQDEINNRNNAWDNYNFRAGVDLFLAKNHTIGVLVSGSNNNRNSDAYNRIALAQESDPDRIDSILVANTREHNQRQQQTYNLNYRFDNTKGRSLNVDLDYGNYRNRSTRYQPNLYYNAAEDDVLTKVIYRFNTPSDIDIYTLTADYEDKLWGGALGVGTKLSRVITDNTFLFYDEPNGIPILNEKHSNLFKYDEKVYATYLNYARKISKKWNFSAGLRAEKTDASGDLSSFLPDLEEPPVLSNYISWFPNAGLTWDLSSNHSLALNGGRRINRPDYNVLNPFNNQISELSYEKGNPFLRPEIVNNIELGYTLAHRYNFKLAYSRTTDKITRLIAPDENDPRAGFITWANLADQTVISFNASIPVQITKWWNAYFNASGSHQDNQANYGNGAVVNVQAYSYTIYQQHTINLPLGMKGEISGYYSGPGIWGGVFHYKSNWSLGMGVQRKFLHDRLNARLSADDIFYKSGWKGYSEFNGLLSYASGRYDSRRISLSLGYRFGNDNVKSRKRSTGLETEAKRVGGD